ncbi:class I SAM-dependent methyltransferase [Streptomyces sp. NPDC050504]|uniref:class I SAM-dependent methyltransferase n=1 Tax=Streptomyces sp. NPDC050504 TaxID=3365618 RepID=UPI0037B1BCC6
MNLLEISDLVIDHDPVTHERRPVPREAVVARLAAAGDRRGARIAATLPCAPDGTLDPDAVDRRLVAVHTELQRLSEELRTGDRITALLRPLLDALRAGGHGRIRIVDVGCGLGYLVRWLAASGALGATAAGATGADVPGADGTRADGVELIGMDFNAALVAEAARLARAEDLPCRFERGDAFAIGGGDAGGGAAATVYVSTGVLHHFRGPDLDAFFAAHSAPGTAAFVHYDIAVTPLAPIGAQVFHRARMRDPLGRHDGIVSARRAHDDATLLRAARHAEGLVPLLYEPRRLSNPFCTTLRPVIGVRPELRGPLRAALGPRLTGTAG